MTTVRTIFDLLKTTFKEWNEDKVPRLAAALAYYTAFSIAPLLIVVIAVAGLAFGEEAARSQIIDQIKGQIGEESAEIIQTMIENTRNEDSGLIATVIGIVTIVLGGAGFFGQLQDALNTVWEVTPKPGGGILNMIKDRFLSFTMVLGIGFLLLVALLISTIVTYITNFASGILPQAELLAQVLNFGLSFLIVTLLFAMIYKVLPDVIIAWSDVWIGAGITALLFTVGKFLLSLYLGNSSVSSTYGAAGSLIVLLLWVYYSAQILLFGAEFTQVYARRYGSQIRPADNAVAITEEQRAQEGMPNREKLDSQQTPAPVIAPVEPLNMLVNDPIQNTESADGIADMKPETEQRWFLFLVGIAIYNGVVGVTMLLLSALRPRPAERPKPALLETIFSRRRD